MILVLYLVNFSFYFEAITDSIYSNKSDVWSFGVVCWELLSEEVPFDGIPLSRLVIQIINNRKRLPIYEEWQEECKMMLER